MEQLSNLEQKNWEHFKLREGEKIFLCKKCLTLSTRPRASFDKQGVCNACNWAEQKKKSVNWGERWKQLTNTCETYRCYDGSRWDCIVPCSGGKDGSYVALRLRDSFAMNPLCVTVKPQLPTEIGRKNVESFQKYGFDHIIICPDDRVYRKLAKKSFIEEGRPKQPFTIAISTAVMKLAIDFNIRFIMYGEEGEEEYGGSDSQIGRHLIDKNYLIDYYYSGHNPDEYFDDSFNKADHKWWCLPSDEELKKADLFLTHWSHFEDWIPSKHYQYVSSKYPFFVTNGRNIGTFTNYGQLDDKLHFLQQYIMKVKFGFGHAWSDACIGIRNGELTREEGIKLVKLYDDEYPWQYHQDFLEYFDMSDEEFWKVVDSFRSPDIWKLDTYTGKWRLRFEIE